MIASYGSNRSAPPGSEEAKSDVRIDLRSRGALRIAEARELVVTRSARAAYESTGAVAKDTVRLRGVDAERPDPIPDRLGNEKVVAVCEDEVVWGGYLGHHYGHFLTECVSRLWALLPGSELEGRPVVLVSSRPWPAFVDEWLDAFGARVFELPDRGAVRFTKMSVPEPAWRLDGWIAPEMRDIHLHVRRHLRIPVPSRDGVLWLSRAKIGRDRAAYDERLVEWLLQDHVTMVHPEELSLARQIAAIEGSRGLAGIVGSAFHTLLLALDPPERLYLCARRVTSGYGAQDLVLNDKSRFLRALVPAGVRRTRRPPSGYRVLIPETLRWLSATLLPELAESPKRAVIGGLVHREIDFGGYRPRGKLDTAVAAVVREPCSVGARMELGELFEAEGRSECALEQFTLAADMSDSCGANPESPITT
jgi:Glycosyltransferase 61